MAELLVRPAAARAARAAPAGSAYPIIIGVTAALLAQFAAYVTFSERIAPYVWALLGLGVLAVAAAAREATE